MEGEEIMFDKIKFKIQVLKSGKSMQEIASMLGINQATLYRKINGTSDFLRSEIQRLNDYLDIADPDDIFFAKEITQMQDRAFPKT